MIKNLQMESLTFKVNIYTCWFESIITNVYNTGHSYRSILSVRIFILHFILLKQSIRLVSNDNQTFLKASLTTCMIRLWPNIKFIDCTITFWQSGQMSSIIKEIFVFLSCLNEFIIMELYAPEISFNQAFEDC